MSDGPYSKKLFTKLGDSVYPYFEIINFVGELLLFKAVSRSEVPLEDPRSVKILNILQRVQKEIRVL